MARTEKMIFSYVVPVFIVAALELAFGIIGESLLMILPPPPEHAPEISTLSLSVVVIGRAKFLKAQYHTL